MNKKGMALALGCAILGGGAAAAQTSAQKQPPQSSSKAFNEFRSNMLQEFSDFKKKILDNYADFLNGEWHEFEPILEPNPQFEVPKPKKMPVSDGVAMTGEAIKMEAKINPDAMPGLKTAPTKKGKETKEGDSFFDGGGFGSASFPSIFDKKEPKSNYDLAVSGESDPGFAFGDLPGQEAMPDDDGIGFVEEDYEEVATQTTNRSSVFRVYSNGDKKNKNSTTVVKKPKDEAKANKRRWTWKFWERNKAKHEEELAQNEPAAQPQPQTPAIEVDNEEIPADVLADLEAGNVEDFFFDFYGMPMFIPELKFTIAKDLNGEKETGEQWTNLDKQPAAKEAARQLFGLAHSMGLNGYLGYRLAEAYVNAKFPDSSQLSRTSATHYLLSQMGYDARMWVSRSANFAGIMLPFDQTVVFGLQPWSDNGRRYHILPPPGYTQEDVAAIAKNNGGFTYRVPVVGGKTSDLRLTGLSLPYKPHKFDITGGKINIKGEVNENFMKMIYRYPQMPMGDYATSWLDADLRADLVDQIRSQIAGMSQKEAIQALLGFFHDREAIDYATDQEQHGFEKPYFLEENLYYPKNDCEDRAIFLTYLVWNAMNLPCELIQYPGHESAAVMLEERVPGYTYTYDGMTFTSADPTYLNAPVGSVMTDFRGVNPKVDKVYK